MESPLLFTSIPLDGDQTDEDTYAQEQALVEAAKHDVSAFATLYELYFARVYRYLRIRVQQEEDAADLAQQIFLQALDALPHYQSRGAPFAAWLFAIARNVLAGSFRRRPATQSLEASGDLAADHELDANVLRHETYEQLSKLLDALDPAARDLLALRFAAGLTAPEIAATIGKRPDAVRKQLSRLLQTLKEQYHDRQ